MLLSKNFIDKKMNNNLKFERPQFSMPPAKKSGIAAISSLTKGKSTANKVSKYSSILGAIFAE